MAQVREYSALYAPRHLYGPKLLYLRG